MQSSKRKWAIVAVGLVAIGIGAASLTRSTKRPPPRAMPADLIGSLRGPVADAAGLKARIEMLEARVADNADDHTAGIALAEALVRQARVSGNAAHAARAEQYLRNALESDPGDYNAQRMLGVVLLSLHKFEEAIEAGRRARNLRPDDAFNYGVIGDGLLELGRYDEAFAAFQTMIDIRPNAASYARASYALELQGHLDAALDTMQKAANATSPRDAEGLAWTLAQVGDLLLRLDRVAAAEAQYRTAGKVFPNHPFVLIGQARVYAARKQDDLAIALAQTLLDRAPSMRLAAFIGDLHARNGRSAEADRLYALAETIGRDVSTDDSLAGFLAEHDRQLNDAVALAERMAARRQDVHSLDALAWTYFRVGRVGEAATVIDKALRTGTRERRIVLHAAAIKAAAGDASGARKLAHRAAPRDPDFDVLSSDKVMELLTSAARLANADMRAAK